MEQKKQEWLGASALGMLATAAHTEYPERPVNMVIPFSARLECTIQPSNRPERTMMGEGKLSSNRDYASGVVILR